MVKKASTSPMSQEWEALNDNLRGADEKTCAALMKLETNGANRITYIRRIHSRLNKARADRERKELGPQ
jgi:hypothetical protein